MIKSQNKSSYGPDVLGRADLHMHSNFSDGAASIEEIINYIEHHTNLDVIAITDHDTIAGALLAQDIVRHDKYRFQVVVGEEITTKQGEIIGLFLKKRILPHQSFEDTVEEVNRQGGLVVIPHPNLFHFHIHPARIRKLLHHKPSAIAGIELSSFILYDSQDAEKWEALTRQFAVASLAGSDSHELTTIGRAATCFPGRRANDLYSALKEGKTTTFYNHLTKAEKLSFFSHAVKVNVARRLRLNGYHVNQYVPNFSPTKLAVRTIKHYLGLPY